MNLCPLRAASIAWPDDPALVDSRRTLTFSQWDGCAEALTDQFNDLKPGHTIAITHPDRLESLVLMTAAWRKGLTVAPISHRIPNSGATTRMLGVHRVFHGPEIVLHEPIKPPKKDIYLDDSIATILLTSGSSGQPKAVAHAIAAHVCSARSSNLNIPFQSGHLWLMSLSISHIGGLAVAFRAMLGGGCVAFPSASQQLASAIKTFQPSHISLVATQFAAVLKQLDHTQLKAVLTGGGPIPTALIGQAVEMGVPIHTTYGMTEMASQVTTTPPNATRAQLMSSGCVLDNNHVKISPNGEIWVRGPSLFSGYLTDKGMIKGVDKDGWYHTGDTGQLNSGWLSVSGRMDDMFVSGGENIHPQEIEAALLGIKGVAAACVVSVPNPRWGARPIAFIDGSVSQNEIINNLEGSLPRFKIPDKILPWPLDISTAHKPPRDKMKSRALKMIQVCTPKTQDTNQGDFNA